MNPSRSFARPFNECMPCLLMLRLVMLTLVAIITSTTMVLTGPPSRDPNSSGLAIPMAFASAERPSDTAPAETISSCDSPQFGSTAVAGSSDPRLKGSAIFDELSVGHPLSAGPCPAAATAAGPGRDVESTGFDRRLPILLTPRAIPR